MQGRDQKKKLDLHTNTRNKTQEPVLDKCYWRLYVFFKTFSSIRLEVDWNNIYQQWKEYSLWSAKSNAQHVVCSTLIKIFIKLSMFQVCRE